MISMTSRPGAAEFFTEVDQKALPIHPDLGVLIGIATAHRLTMPPPQS
jgi:hypothetical protein